MKKLLALVLALVMSMSLVTISNAAYSDAADIDYTEAVDVMSAIGVLQGSDGKFNPDGILTRAEACTIITKILGMADYVGTSSFADVKGHWGESAISFCAGEGIVNGTSATTFDPNGKLTGYAFGKMLLVALGYNAEIEKMTGTDWTIGVAKLIKSLKLNDGISGFVGSANLSRQTAAQMALNALQSVEVAYGKSQSVTNKGEVTTSTNLSASPVEIWDSAAGAYVATTLMKDFFPKLVKTNTAATADAFGRPATKWAYKGVDIGTYANEATYTYTADQDTKDGKAAIKAAYKDYNNYNDGDHKVPYVLNGKGMDAVTFTDANFAALTENGRLVEVYVKDNAITKIVAVDTVLAKVTKVDTKAETVNYDAKIDSSNFSMNSQTKGYGDVAKDDYVLLTMTTTTTNGVLTTAANNTIKSVAAATKVTGILSSVNTTKNTVTVAGTTYNMASTAWNDDATASAKYDATLYLDANGYVVYVKSGAAATSDKAVAVLKKYQSLNKDGVLVDMIKGVTSNGETVEWEVEQVGGSVAVSSISLNTVYTYADTDDNGAYELTAVAETKLNVDDATVTMGNTYVTATQKSMTDSQETAKTAYFDSNVKFIFVNGGKAVVRDGVQKYGASNDKKATVVTVNKGNDNKYYITAVYVLAAAPSSAAATGDVVFVGGANGTTSVLDKSDNKAKTFSTYEAYINGEEVANFYAAASAAKGFYYAKVDEDTGAYVLTGNTYAATEGKMAVKANLSVTATAGNIITAGGNDYDLTNATIVDLYAGADISSVADIDTNKDAVKVYVMFDADTAAASYVYVVSAAV